jgi:aspartyl-tRNA(Asn)/glutamyl-tRNA(Gln) amidotransferase subunit A
MAGRMLEDEGAILSAISLPLTEAVFPAYFLIANAEASSNLARYDGVRLGNAQSEAENLEDRYVENRSRGFGKEVQRRIMLGTYIQTAGFGAGWHEKALRVRRKVCDDLRSAFASVDLLLTPVTPGPPFRFGERLRDPLRMYLTDVFNTAANLGGNPALSVPAGKDSQGRPMAVQLMADLFREDLCYRAASVIEGVSDTTWGTN